MEIKVRFDNEMQSMEVDAAEMTRCLSIEVNPNLSQEELTVLIQTKFDDEFNKPEYNNWHKFDRHRDSKLKQAYEEDDDIVDGMDCFSDEKSLQAFDKVLDYDDACAWVSNCLSDEQADAFIAVVLDDVTPEEYADSHDLKRDTVYKRLQRAKEKLKKYFL